MAGRGHIHTNRYLVYLRDSVRFSARTEGANLGAYVQACGRTLVRGPLSLYLAGYISAMGNRLPHKTIFIATQTPNLLATLRQ